MKPKTIFPVLILIIIALLIFSMPDNQATTPVTPPPEEKKTTRVIDKKIPSGKVTTVNIEATGNGSCDKWKVLKGTAAFTINALSTIESKIITDEVSGRTRSIEESRKIKISEQQLLVYKTNLINHFRSNKWKNWAYGTASLLAAVPEPYCQEGAIGITALTKTISKLDNKSPLDLLAESFSSSKEIVNTLKEVMNKAVEEDALQCFATFQEYVDRDYIIGYDIINGKTVRRPSLKRKDSQELDDTEGKMLRKSSYFSDFYIVKGEPEIGESWSVSADEFQGIFSPFIEDGNLEGDLKATRIKPRQGDDQNKIYVTLKNGLLRIVDSEDTTSFLGELKEFACKLTLDKRYYIESGKFSGEIKLIKVSSEHILDGVKVDGFVKLRGEILTKSTFK